MAGRGGAPQALKRPKGLTPRMWKAAKFLAELPPAYSDLKDAAAKLNVPHSTLWDWTKQDQFVQAVADLTRRNVIFFVPKVYATLVKGAVEGKASATMMFLTHFDGYTEKTATNLESNSGTVKIQFGSDELSADEKRRMGELLVEGGETPVTMQSLGIKASEPEPRQDEAADVAAETVETPEPVQEAE